MALLGIVTEHKYLRDYSVVAMDAGFMWQHHLTGLPLSLSSHWQKAVEECFPDKALPLQQEEVFPFFFFFFLSSI